MDEAGCTTYLVESYVPGLDPDRAAHLDRQVRDAVATLRGDGLRVVWGGSLAISAEETYSYLVTCEGSAADAAVAAIGVGAALACDHVAEVVVVRPPLGTDVAPA
ncbi:MAG: hypothetical protein QOD68_931 [Actinomycetota bacterium]|nr:hypothetical protein [Actinomycetota bacterium]